MIPEKFPVVKSPVGKVYSQKIFLWKTFQQENIPVGKHSSRKTFQSVNIPGVNIPARL